MSETIFLDLPLDVLITIFKYLNSSDLRNVVLTCKTLKNVIHTANSIWKFVSRNKLILYPKTDTSWYNKSRISHNWCNGIYKDKVIIQHNSNYMPWIHFFRSEAIFLAVGSSLKCYCMTRQGISKCNLLWSLDVPTIKRNDIRTNDISRFIIKANLIVCGNRDGCVTMYEMNNLKTPKLLNQIEDCHEKGFVEVSAVEKVGSMIVTASSNSSYILFWNSKNENDTHKNIEYGTAVLLPEQLGCRSLAASIHEDKLAFGVNGNSKPLFLDVHKSAFLFQCNAVRNIKQVVRDIQWRDENCVVYVSHSGKLEMMDTRTGSVVYETSDPFQSSLYCVKTDGDHTILVGSSEYSRCVLFDIRRQQHLQMYFTQKKSSPVYSLDFDSTRLLAAADRGVAILNFNVSTATTRQRDYSHAFEVVTR